jgi:hypothetical protein
MFMVCIYDLMFWGLAVLCQSSSNVLTHIAVAFFSAMSQQEDAAPTYESHNGSNSGGVEHAAIQWTRTLVNLLAPEFFI